MKSRSSTVLPGVGEGGGVCSIAFESVLGVLSCERLMRLLGCDSGERGAEADIEGVEEVEAEAVEGRPDDDFEERAARAACVMGMWIPRLGRESDLRLVL